MPMLLFPGGPAFTGVDLANVLADILPALGATSFGDLDWATQGELFQWLDEANKRLGNRAGFWVERYGNQTLNVATASVSVPVGHVDTIHVSFNGSKLRPAGVRELAALDPSWPSTTGPAPARFSMDAGAPGTITTYPITNTLGTLAIVYQRFQPTVVSGSSVIPIPTPVEDYFGYSVMQEARRKESDAAMPDMADHFGQRVDLYLQVIEHLWGPGR